jgi:uncharacterized membrane protein YcaP (DUF421 family)
MDNGELYRENLKKAKLDINEFLVMCREQGYFDLASIQTAIFEYNGKLTILPSSTRRPATPQDFQLSPKQELLFAEIIMDGEIIEKNLKSIGLDINWLSKQLAQQGISSPKDVSLGVCDRNQNVSFYMKDDMKD